jgi:HSP20 family protein
MFVRVKHFPVAAPVLDPIFDFDREMAETFGNILRMPESRPVSRYPAVDIAEGENESVVVAELPGMKKEEIALSIHEGILTMSGERKSPALPEKSLWVRSERSAGKFSRAIQLPHDVKLDAVTAELTNGVLRITLPKTDAVRPREITVK